MCAIIASVAIVHLTRLKAEVYNPKEHICVYLFIQYSTPLCLMYSYTDTLHYSVHVFVRSVCCDLSLLC